jgi:hypothetical protein
MRLSSLAPWARGICFRWRDGGLEGFYGLAPVIGQVVPSWVVAFDRGDALRAHPVFDGFLAVDGVADQVKFFEVHEAIDFVLLGKALDFACLVLRDSPLDVVGHTRVEAARLACHDVHEEAVFARHIFCRWDASGSPAPLIMAAETLPRGGGRAYPPRLRGGDARDDKRRLGASPPRRVTTLDG